ncbi:MAG: LTA synthase family protein [Cellulosilyticum sp.]|nr:LTA synthase family protein [Cellulosilyticum sp.]
MNSKKELIIKIGIYSLIIGISIIEEVMFELSAHNLAGIVLNFNVNYFVYTMVATLFFVAVNVLIYSIFEKKTVLAYGVCMCFVLCVSLSCYFIYLWHGVPFSFVELKNIDTAKSVVNSYLGDIISFHSIYSDYLIIIITLVILLVLLHKLLKKDIVNIKINIGIILIAILLFCSSYTNKVIPESVVSFNWAEGIVTYGYFNCMLRESLNELQPLSPSIAYDKDDYKALESYEYNEDRSTNTPDIILILNETFFDISQVIDVDYNENPITVIPSLENALTGYAVVPNEGGGTNCSEYELLTSNSLSQMLQSITPFQSLDTDGANSIVSVLENSGYETLGTHDSYGINYSRNRGYTDLGFDTVYFIEDYTGLTTWGSRTTDEKYTDESQYNNLINWYEQMGDGPRFLYCLTMQNHGAWSLNSYDENIIHLSNDYGDYTSQLDEYNSCIYLSDQAIGKLISYYETVDRDVVVVMLGDHCPNILSNVVNEYYSDIDVDERNLKMRSVPYVIWSNNDELLTDNRPQETLGLVYLMPTVLESAGMQMSAYYEYLLELRDDVPILTKYGYYYDKYGKMYSYSEDSEYTDDINYYFGLEYSNIEDYKESGFFK